MSETQHQTEQKQPEISEFEKLRQIELEKIRQQEEAKKEIESYKKEIEQIKQVKVKMMEDKQKELLQEIQEVKACLAEEKAEKQKLKDLKELDDIIKSSEDFELVSAYGAQDQVLNFIREHEKDTGEKLTKKEALEKVEKYYYDLEEKRHQTLKATKKAQKWYGGDPSAVKLQSSQSKVASTEPTPELSKDELIAVQKMTRSEHLNYLKSKFLKGN